MIHFPCADTIPIGTLYDKPTRLSPIFCVVPSKPGKKFPSLNLGMRKGISPTCVSQTRRRYPSEKLALMIAVSIPFPILVARIVCCSKELAELQVQNLLQQPSQKAAHPAIGIFAGLPQNSLHHRHQGYHVV